MDFYVMGLGYNLISLICLVVFFLITLFISVFVNNIQLEYIIEKLDERQRNLKITKKELKRKLINMTLFIIPYVYVILVIISFIKILYGWSKYPSFAEYVLESKDNSDNNDPDIGLPAQKDLNFGY